MSGARQLFTNAPITQAAPVLPAVAPGSNLAAAMMRPTPFALQTPSTGVPLSSMMAIKNAFAPTPNPAPGNNQSSLVQQPDGTWAAPPGGGTAAAPQPLSWSAPAVQAQAPGIATTGAPGMPSMGAPGVPSGGAPGMPDPNTPGVPSTGQPGQSGQISAWLQGLLGNGGAPAVGTGGG